MRLDNLSFDSLCGFSLPGVAGTCAAIWCGMHRQFTDKEGRGWDVWEVIPQFAERREAQTAVPVERRADVKPRASLPVEMREGWLAFESRDERRRLAPAPLGWELLSDRELVELLERATLVGKVRRGR